MKTTPLAAAVALTGVFAASTFALHAIGTSWWVFALSGALTTIVFLLLNTWAEIPGLVAAPSTLAGAYGTAWSTVVGFEETFPPAALAFLVPWFALVWLSLRYASDPTTWVKPVLQTWATHQEPNHTTPAAQWADRVARICSLPQTPTPTGPEQPWATGYGFTLDLDLPGGGTTWTDIARAADRLAADAKLPNGCGVEVSEGPHRGSAVLKVATANAFANPTNFTPTVWATSYTNGLKVGCHRDGTPALFPLLDSCAIVVGQRGSGKTNLLQVLTARALECNDVLVWHIDLNGGGMSRPWVDHGGTTPGLDWVAATLTEAENMLDTAITIAHARKQAYQDRMRAANDDKLPIGPDVPAILIIIDEGAEALARRESRALCERVDKLVSIGRAMRVGVVISGLRATSDVLGSANLKAQAGVRACLRTSQASEIAHLLGWEKGLSPADITQTGAGFLLNPESSAPSVFRADRITPADTTVVLAGAGTWRPALDRASTVAAGPNYTNRWAGTQWATQPTNTPTGCGQPNPTNQNRTNQPTSHQPVDGPGWGEKTKQLRDCVADLAAKRDALRAKNETTAAFTEIVGHLAHNTTTTKGLQVPVPPKSWRAEATKALTVAATTGLRGEDLLTALNEHPEIKAPSRSTLYTWLAANATNTGGVWTAKTTSSNPVQSGPVQSENPTPNPGTCENTEDAA